MKKKLLSFLILTIIVFPGIVYADGFDSGFPIASLSFTAGYIPGVNEFELALGLGLKVPLLFMKKEIGDGITSYFMSAPTAVLEYGFLNNLLRVKAGVHFGKFEWGFLGFADYYIGVSGIFMQDLTHDIPTFGIMPEIGFELWFFWVGFRVQMQYDFYLIREYNHFSVTVAFIEVIPWEF